MIRYFSACVLMLSVTGLLVACSGDGGGSGGSFDNLSQDGYVKASNAEVDDRFGSRLAIEDKTLIVGVGRESSNATGINGDEADNSAFQSGAVYAVRRTGGEWRQEAYIKASNTDQNDFFGGSVAIDGDTVVVGAHYEASNATGINGDQTDNSIPGSGAVYVFTRAGAAWTQQAYIKASNTDPVDFFGGSVAIDRDTLVVGAYGEASSATGINGDQTDNSAINSGAVYVFTRTGATWTQQAYIKASNAGFADNFGGSVAIDGDTLVVGAYGEASSATGINGDQTDNSESGSGAVYVFTRTGTTWTQQAYIKASNTEADDGFGTSVSISGDTLVVGASGEDGGSTGVNGDGTDNYAPDSGAAFVFTRKGTTWKQQAYLKASNTDDGDGFGSDVAISGEAIIIGAPYEDGCDIGINGYGMGNCSSTEKSGAAYLFLFTHPDRTWTQYAYIKASNTDIEDLFGTSVSISGYTLAVGAPGKSSTTGAAYVFR